MPHNGQIRTWWACRPVPAGCCVVLALDVSDKGVQLGMYPPIAIAFQKLPSAKFAFLPDFAQ